MNKAVTKRVAMHGTGREYLRRLSADIRRDRWLYALLVPGVVYFLVFKYLPMWGVVMAFENYVPFSGRVRQRMGGHEVVRLLLLIARVDAVSREHARAFADEHRVLFPRADHSGAAAQRNAVAAL